MTCSFYFPFPFFFFLFASRLLRPVVEIDSRRIQQDLVVCGTVQNSRSGWHPLSSYIVMPTSFHIMLRSKFACAISGNQEERDLFNGLHSLTAKIMVFGSLSR